MVNAEKRSRVGPMPSRADGIRSRAAVLEAAKRLFSSVGPDVPLSQVAAEAGVGRASLYRAFPSRSHLAIELVAESHEEMRDFIADLPPEPASFLVMVEHILVKAFETADWVELIMDPATRDEAARLAEALNRRVEPLLRLAQDAGVVRPDLEPGDVRMLIRMVQGARGPRGYAGPDETPRAARLLVDAIQVQYAEPLPVIH